MHWVTSTTCATRLRRSVPELAQRASRQVAETALRAPGHRYNGASGSVRARTGAGTVGAVPVDIRLAKVDDYEDLYVAFSRIVGAGEGFPQASPLTRAQFDEYWIEHSSAVAVAKFGGFLIGAYYIKPNFVGRAAHIANAGYFVLAPYRGTGVGRTMVEHSL